MTFSDDDLKRLKEVADASASIHDRYDYCPTITVSKLKRCARCERKVRKVFRHVTFDCDRQYAFFCQKCFHWMERFFEGSYIPAFED
jgi:hypothetical protein